MLQSFFGCKVHWRKLEWEAFKPWSMPMLNQIMLYFSVLNSADCGSVVQVIFIADSLPSRTPAPAWFSGNLSRLQIISLRSSTPQKTLYLHNLPEPHHLRQRLFFIFLFFFLISGQVPYYGQAFWLVKTYPGKIQSDECTYVKFAFVTW
jgi:hypothetical protein